MSQGSSEKKSENKKITILVIICSILGLAAVTLTTNGALRILLLLMALVIAITVWAYVSKTVKTHPHAHTNNAKGDNNEK